MVVLREKDDIAEVVNGFLVEPRTHGDVEIVWSDGGGEFRSRFSKAHVDNRIKQEFMTPDIPQYNDVVEQELALMETNRQATCI